MVPHRGHDHVVIADPARRTRLAPRARTPVLPDLSTMPAARRAPPAPHGSA
jgi:hypothetical protein